MTKSRFLLIQKIMTEKKFFPLVSGLLSEYFCTKVPGMKRVAMFYIRYQRGNGLINIFKDLMTIIGVGGLLIGWKLDWPLEVFVLLGLVWIFLCYTTGYLDEKYGFWKHQEAYYSGEINTFIKEMGQKIDRLDKKINGRTKVHY